MLRDRDFDLIAAMKESLWALPGRRSDPPPDEVPCFIVDDLAREARARGTNPRKVAAIIPSSKYVTLRQVCGIVHV
jgi:hypothetical protein